MSGDYDWLTQRMPAIEKSVTFLLSMYNSSVGLLNVPGSLYIDVFIRYIYFLNYIYNINIK